MSNLLIEEAKKLALINPENVSKTEGESYPVREAARAVVIDRQNMVALLHVVNQQYYKLPGGGIEKSEDKETALKRECKEEIGSEIEIVSEIGCIVEYRKIFNLKQISYCYLAKLKGKKGVPSYTDEEMANGFKQIWLPYERALDLISNNAARNIEGRDYIVPRDMLFLKAAQNYL